MTHEEKVTAADEAFEKAWESGDAEAIRAALLNLGETLEGRDLSPSNAPAVATAPKDSD
jgi:hypothetical protein